MSNEIYGFADLPDSADVPKSFRLIRELTSLGFFAISAEELIGFPSHLQPKRNSLIFVIGDSPDSINAEYLLDYQDYDPHGICKLPLNASERLSLLIDLLTLLYSELQCNRIVLCMTLNNQIDSIKYLNSSEMHQILNDDLHKESPPCMIYVISRNKRGQNGSVENL